MELRKKLKLLCTCTHYFSPVPSIGSYKNCLEDHAINDTLVMSETLFIFS